MKLNWKTIDRPIIALSPMADMTDSAYCRIVKQKASPILFREMISSEGIIRANPKTREMAKIHSEERPIVQQIFGSDPDKMAEAAKIIVDDFKPEGIDINMGCPVYKMTSDFNGASLMKDPERATEIVRKVKAAVDVPVSVKIRAGWSDSNECVEFAKLIEKAGADLITVHGRTKTQGYAGDSDWTVIKKVKEAVSIPVLANGDIFTAPLALSAIKETECDGVLIARGGLGNPWIFKQIEELISGKTATAITLKERVETVKAHLKLHIERYGDGSVTTFRKHLVWYFRGINGYKPFRQRLHTVSTLEEANQVLDEILKDGLVDDGLSSRDATHPDSHQRRHITK
jgi:tRNA-dihydrouridine synthase B